MTVDGNPDFHRNDSMEGQPTIYEDDDTSSVYGNDDQLDSNNDIEETLKADAQLKYRTEQLHMRHLVVKGILESEKSYLHVIEQLVKAKHYLQSLAMQSGQQAMALEDVTTIFYKMDDFYKIHREFVGELTEKVKNWSDDQKIANAVKNLVVYCKVYEDYVNNYPKAVEAIRKYQRNEETKHLLQLDSNNDIEETLTADAQLKYRTEQLHMRHLVVKGILDSEKSYLHVIEQLVKANHYFQSLAMRPGPQAMAIEDVTTISYKMDDFYQIHREFVGELKIFQARFESACVWAVIEMHITVHAA